MAPFRKYAMVLAVLVPSSALATPDNLTQQRQAEIQRILTSAGLKEVTAIRGFCASGEQPAAIARDRKIGLVELPDASAYCVAALTRIGRTGKLGYVRDKRSTSTTPANAFDNGFVTAYLKGDAIPANLPTMAALKPTAEHCLGQDEHDIDLCHAVGYAYGVRAANGEIVRAL